MAQTFTNGESNASVRSKLNGNAAELTSMVFNVPSYAAYVTQSNTDNPVPNFKSNIGASISWTRDAMGYFTITASSSVFTDLKTVVIASGTGASGYIDPKQFYIERQSGTVLKMGVIASGAADDNFKMNIIIMVLP